MYTYLIDDATKVSWKGPTGLDIHEAFLRRLPSHAAGHPGQRLFGDVQSCPPGVRMDYPVFETLKGSFDRREHGHPESSCVELVNSPYIHNDHAREFIYARSYMG